MFFLRSRVSLILGVHCLRFGQSQFEKLRRFTFHATDDASEHWMHCSSSQKVKTISVGRHCTRRQCWMFLFRFSRDNIAAVPEFVAATEAAASERLLTFGRREENER